MNPNHGQIEILLANMHDIFFLTFLCSYILNVLHSYKRLNWELTIILMYQAQMHSASQFFVIQ
jgi:hypothetical protein